MATSTRWQKRSNFSQSGFTTSDTSSSPQLAKHYLSKTVKYPKRSKKSPSARSCTSTTSKTTAPRNRTSLASGSIPSLSTLQKGSTSFLRGMKRSSTCGSLLSTECAMFRWLTPSTRYPEQSRNCILLVRRAPNIESRTRQHHQGRVACESRIRLPDRI